MLCNEHPYEHENNNTAYGLPTHDILFTMCASDVVAREGLCGWGNFEKQTYTRDNHQIADGVLMITVSAPADMRHIQQQQTNSSTKCFFFFLVNETIGDFCEINLFFGLFLFLKSVLLMPL